MIQSHFQKKTKLNVKSFKWIQSGRLYRYDLQELACLLLIHIYDKALSASSLGIQE